jgi:non-specific serine/threonine protein kinase/serine/threonine-protein kinase
VNPADWDDVKRLFGEALEHDESKRAEFLERTCGSRMWVRSEVESLLDAHARAGAFFETRAGATQPRQVATDDDLVGQRLGPYQVEELLGRGGMGAVYRARRSTPEREVALKVVRLESGGPDSERRFAAECQILARLEHPWIASLFDAGTTPEGRAYFVMELVRGQALDEMCRRTRPSLRERLDLFLKLCEAVSYAHGRLVVHRDLKPGNILITTDGRPKLLDFGIARLLGEASPSAVTDTGLRLMTPEFASPEQVRGELATVATDVHGLGLLLSLLLTGRAPFLLRSSAPAELVRVVCVDEPRAPSASVGAPCTGPTSGFEPPEPARSLTRLLKGDLDAIVLKALRKEPRERYTSVEQFAADVRAYLAGRPVQARGGRWRYRLGKFARRQRLPLALGAALVVAVAAGWVATARQAQVAREQRARAERRFNDVRRLSTQFLFEFHDTVAELPGSTAARAMVLKTAVDYLDKLAREAGDDTALRIELARAYRRLGQAQGVPGSGNLGDSAGALQSLQRARQVLDQVTPGARAERAYRSARIDVCVELARAHEQAGEYDSFHALLREAAQEAAALRDDARELTQLESVGRAYYDWSFALERNGRLVEAEAAAVASLSVSEQVRARWPERLNHARRLAPASHRVASIQLRLGRVAAARRHAQTAVELRRAGLAPANAQSIRGLVAALPTLALALERSGDLAGAEAAYAEALQAAQSLVQSDPRDRQARNDAAAVAGEWCAVQNRAGRRERPRDLCLQALRVFEAHASDSDELTQFNLASMSAATGRVRELQGATREALLLHERALAVAQGAVLAGGGESTVRLQADIWAGLARVRLTLGQIAAARAAGQKAAALLAPLARGSQDAETLELHVATHLALARIELAGGAGATAHCAVLVPAAASIATLSARGEEQTYLRPLLSEYQRLAEACRGPS